MAADHEYVKNVVNNSEGENVNIRTMEHISTTENEENSECDVNQNYKEGDELLIDLVKPYPHLWNKEDKDYKDLNKRDNSWEEIANIMQQPGKYLFFIKKNLLYIRNVY